MAAPFAEPALSMRLSPLPAHLEQRNRMFETLLKRQHELAADTAACPRRPITVSLKLSAESVEAVPATSWLSTPAHLLSHVSKDEANDIVVSRVDDQLWDLSRPLEGDCQLAYVTVHDKDGQSVFWHSAAHLLGEAAEHQYGCLISHGPPTATGFFYDMALPNDQAVNPAEFASLESRAKQFVKAKQPLERLLVSKENLREMFSYSKYKLHYIEKFIPDGGSSTVYRNGSLVDLCQGPHVQNTKQIRAFAVTGCSSAYFLGDQVNDSLQRISGVAFPDNNMLKAWNVRLQELKKRDHQEIGRIQKLFWFSPLSPGSPFLLPHGTRIFNAIQTMLREQYWERGYEEVHSPLMYDSKLWKQSGHWAHYRDDMFCVARKSHAAIDDNATSTAASHHDCASGTIHGQEESDPDKGLFALKPMNCPGHALMFASEDRSYRDLPWRVADFSVLHRNEASGALSGLTRVRKFQQDDAHIFCTLEQVSGELRDMFDFLTHVYDMFGFAFKVKLSTRPEKYTGALAVWDKAEAQLREALDVFRGPGGWELNPGDGAFYGPKIDVTVADAMGREFQCATVQLDFQLPRNFNLLYRTAGVVDPGSVRGDRTGDAKGDDRDDASIPPGLARPVMIHRAVIGSFDRFIAIITEHFGGKWPFWLSPRQVQVIPVTKTVEDYAREVQRVLHRARLYVDIDLSPNTLQKKIFNANALQYNFVLVVGHREMESRAVNVRNRDGGNADQGVGKMMALDEVVDKMKALRDERRLADSLI